MIVLFTDFGLNGPYTGQMKAVLHRDAPGVPVVDLFADAPSFNPRASAYLLAGYVAEFPPDTVFLCVVDPGVGTAGRRPVLVKAGGRWFVGPDNGLFNVVVARAEERERWEIKWRPDRLSSSFHGRDLFAPVAARIAGGEMPEMVPAPWSGDEFKDWPEDLAEVIYIDHFGNAMTGLRANRLKPDAKLEVGGVTLNRARTFGEVVIGKAFWYENANGLVEIAVNSGSAVEQIGLHIGSKSAN